MVYQTLMSALNNLISEVKRHLNLQPSVKLQDIVLKINDTSLVMTDTSDATATAADIAKGVVAFNAKGKVVGTNSFQNVPRNTFYKCASVHTESNTWDGYKLKIISDWDQSGMMVASLQYSTTLTSGLSYSVKVPEVDKVYTPDALLEINISNYGGQL